MVPGPASRSPDCGPGRCVRDLVPFLDHQGIRIG